jgi:hypothetical protein
MKLLLSALLLMAAAPSPEIRYFQYQRPVQLAPSATGQACALLDTSTFSHAATGLSDVRLYRGSDESPYVVHYARPSQSSQPTITPTNLGQRGGKTVFDASMPEGEYTDLQLNLTGQNFLATVTVFGSQTVAGPSTRIGSFTVFDFTGQHLGRSTVLHLPRSNYRYLHFEITGPIATDRVLGIAAAPAPPVEPQYITILSAGAFAQAGRTSVAQFDLPPNVPIDRIVFAPAVPHGNFSRNVEIQALEISPQRDSSEPPPVPVTVASGNLLRIHDVQEGHHIDEEHLALDSLQSSFNLSTRWTITVQNGDDVPLQFSSVQVQMLQRNLCFELTPGAAYTLYYGDKALLAPVYDYATWFAFQPKSDTATLGPEQSNPLLQPRPDTRAFTEKHPALLWIALVIVVLLLGLIAFRTARRVQPPPQVP